MDIGRPRFKLLPRLHAYRGRRPHVYGESTFSRPSKNPQTLQFCEASRRHIFAVGQVYVTCAVLILTTRTGPLLPGRVSMMRLTDHRDRPIESTFRSTRSPACMLRVSFVHLLRAVSVGRYLYTHRLQNWSVRNWAWRHLFLEHM